MEGLKAYRNKVQYWTGTVLRDNPRLRTVQERMKLIEKVWEVSKTKFNPESITRSARKLQNTEGLYQPLEKDRRQEMEKETREYYAK